MRSIAIRLLAVFAFIVPAFAQTQIDIDSRTQGSRLPFFSTDSGAANAYSITPVAPVTVLRTGSCFIWKAANANTTASTLVVSGFSSHNITKNGSTALASGDIAANRIVETCYDGTQYQLLSPGSIATGGSITCSQLPALTGDVTTSAGSCATTLASTAVTPGSYTSADITVDAKGRVTAAANGSGGVGTVTTTGSPSSGNLTKFSGAASVTNGDLSGDVTTSGALVATVPKVNGVSYGSSPSTHQVPVVTASNTATYKTVPDCTDTGGNHINYTQSTDVWSCGTSGSGGTTTLTTYVAFDQCTAGQSTNAGNAFWTVAALTNWDAGHWEFAKNTNADIFCSVRIPHNVAGTPAANIVIDPGSNDSTNAHTAALSTCDAITSSLNLQVGSLSCAGSQNYSSTTTAYAVTELTFAVQATVAADQILVVKIHQASGGANTANIIMPTPKLKIDQTL